MNAPGPTDARGETNARGETSAARTIRAGRAALGIEFGSTRIKACLVDGDDPATVLAVGAHAWANSYVDGVWTYPLDAVWAGVRAAFTDLVADAERRHAVRPTMLRAFGVSAMMHGYLAFDGAGELLVPFRTWRNTTTGPAAAELSDLLGVNIPLRWSVAHLRQAERDGEEHVPRIAAITTLAGYVHERLTGRRVLGVGDASGMFPVAEADGCVDYDERLLAHFDARSGRSLPPLRALLPEVLPAGADAGALSPEGAALLDETGALQPGAAACPPEGDAGTGMVATGAVAPGTGNVSAGTSVFAMVVMDRPLTHAHAELDVVATPAGAPVAMVHCNNGASELAEWVGLFARFAAATGAPLDDDAAFEVLVREAIAGEPDAGGLLAYNHLAGEPIAGLTAGRPLFVRTPESTLSLANFMRAQLYGVFGTLALGMRVLADEGVPLQRMFAHGGLFRTPGAPQRFLAAALAAPVAVGDTAAEGGAWGIAVLAAYRRAVADGDERRLDAYLAEAVFAGAAASIAHPDPVDVAGFAAYLDRYRAGLAVEAAAVIAL